MTRARPYNQPYALNLANSAETLGASCRINPSISDGAVIKFGKIYGAAYGCRHVGRRSAAFLTGTGETDLIFDQLELRVLLNTDFLTVQLAAMPNDFQAHSVLVQLVQQTAQVARQSQVVEQVQVTDKLHGNALLAIGDLSHVNGTSIQDGPGGTIVELNADSFGAHTVPAMH